MSPGPLDWLRHSLLDLFCGSTAHASATARANQSSEYDTAVARCDTLPSHGCLLAEITVISQERAGTPIAIGSGKDLRFIDWWGAHLIRQTTLGRAVSAAGHGLHTGEPSHISLKPAPAYTGYVFRRVDLKNFEIPASPQYVARVSYATTLMRQGVMIATVEHLLAALAGSHIDNCLIEIDSLEVPILDGSAEPFIELIEQAGTVVLEAPRQFLRVLKRVEVNEGNRRMSISPAASFSISCLIEFPHPMIGTQRREIEIVDGQFSQEVAPARTFGFLHEIEALRSSGLIRGGSLENAVVLTPEGGVMNSEGRAIC